MKKEMEHRWIAGYENLYSISEYGHVYSWRTKIYRKPTFDKDGYLWVTLHGNNKPLKKFIHTLVLESFVCSRPTKKSVGRHHPDPTKTNNHFTNLMWGTHQQNVHDRAYNSKDNGVILTEDIVMSLKQDIINGFTQIQICKKYNLTRGNVSLIVKNQRWIGVGPDVSGIKYDKRRVLSNLEVSQVKYLINHNIISDKQIQNHYNIKYSSFNKIKSNVSFKNINETTDLSFLNFGNKK